MLSVNKIDEIKEQAFVGAPAQLNNVCNIYPLSVKEIVTMGSMKYYNYLGILLLTEAEISSMLKNKIGIDINPAEVDILNYLLQSSNYDDKFFLELQDAFSTFIKEDIILSPELNSIVVGDPRERRLITSENFKDFQDILRIQNNRPIETPPPVDETPGQRKMRLLREQVAAVKKKQAQKKGEGQTLGELMEIAKVFGIDLNETIYAFYKLLRRYELKEKWDQDIQMLCAGADGKKLKTKYWGESPED